jgi:hypothetical protein
LDFSSSKKTETLYVKTFTPKKEYRAISIADPDPDQNELI